ncbi:MAG: phenylalanine--tRNA ligase subunit alpha [Tenericutes bacterium]|jgi:phenylalanyl-tRNA synthetase alpha chain|nr:phenylalanine--tRNA ligase subunit alpha [Mycoplasmatota bacterium]
MNKEQVEQLKSQIVNDLGKVKNTLELNEVKTNYLGKKGLITELSMNIKEISVENKKDYGLKINELKNHFNDKYNRLNEYFEKENINKKLLKEKIDITLPSTKIISGNTNIIERIIEEIETLFITMGYDVETGPEVEFDLYNFEMLNLPKGHPARDAQDTFYITDEMLLRSHTSPVQVRTMLANKEKSPIRIIVPGKVYRRDNDDPTHSHQFTQVEGLVIDRNLSLADLKGTLNIMVKRLLGESSVTRFRPSFYPFTEPSVEFDVSCFNCQGKGCPVCKHTTWITIGGAGMIHPNVLLSSGYDPKKYTGFAFGFGIERMAMLKYNVNDIRYLYQNDLRVFHNFDKVGE